MKAKKKGYQKNALAYFSKGYIAHAKASCQDGLNCQNPLLHSLKFQHVTLKYCLVIGFMLWTHSFSLSVPHTCIYTHMHTHTHNRKNYPVSCAYTFRNLYCTSFLLPKCSISIREGNGKFACTCTKAHIIHEGNKYVKWMGFWFLFSC